MEKQNQAVSLTPEQLQDMLLTMAKELRRPADLTPEQLAQQQTDREQRAANAQMQAEKERRRRLEQAACTHCRRDGTSTCVYVYPDANYAHTGNFLICQQCQGMIHPEPRPTGPIAKEVENHIFDTNLFNLHYQKSMHSATNF